MSKHEVYELSMDVGATIRQTVEVVVSDLDINDIIEGLMEGKFITTISHDGISTVHGSITDIDGILVAKVLRQREIESVFGNFQLDGDVVEEELAELFMHEEE